MMLASRDLLTPQALMTLIARSRRNVEQSRSLCERASTIVARSVRLCRAPIGGASDTTDDASETTDVRMPLDPTRHHRRRSTPPRTGRCWCWRTIR